MKNNILVLFFSLVSFLGYAQCICKLEDDKILCSQGAPNPMKCITGAEREVRVKLNNGQISQLFKIDSYYPKIWVSATEGTSLSDIGEIRLSDCDKTSDASVGIICQLPNFEVILTGLERNSQENNIKKLLRVYSLMGREVREEDASSGVFIYQYSDGSIKKVMKLE